MAKIEAPMLFIFTVASFGGACCLIYGRLTCAGGIFISFEQK